MPDAVATLWRLMALFEDYRLSRRNARTHVRLTQQLGLVPIAMALIMMFAHRGPPAPGLWSALGLSVGLQLILAGCHGVCFARQIVLRPTTYLVLVSEAWFPLFLFTIQSALMFVTVGLIWFTLLELGFPTTAWLQINLGLLVAAIPGCRLVNNLAQSTQHDRWIAINEACRYAAIVFATTWTAGSITLFMAPPGTRMPPNLYIFAVILWLIVVLVALTCAMLFVDHLLQARKQKD